MRAASATLRAIGPLFGYGLRGICPGPDGTRPGLVRKPTTPQKEAGVRRLPATSEPVASHTSPDASATAEPPEDPAQVSRVSHGLRVMPNASLNVWAPAPNSGVLVLPITSPPCSSRFCTLRQERCATFSR